MSANEIFGIVFGYVLIVAFSALVIGSESKLNPGESIAVAAIWPITLVFVLLRFMGSGSKKILEG